MSERATPDALQRAQLERRRAHLVDQADALREQALAIWRRAQALRAAGRNPEAAEQRALDAEVACYWVNAALIAIADELGEMEDDV